MLSWCDPLVFGHHIYTNLLDIGTDLPAFIHKLPSSTCTPKGCPLLFVDGSRVPDFADFKIWMSGYFFLPVLYRGDIILVNRGASLN